MNWDLVAHGTPGYHLLLALWRRSDEEPVPAPELAREAKIHEGDAARLLAEMTGSGFVETEGSSYKLTERTQSMMEFHEKWAYIGLGVHLGMYPRGQAGPVTRYWGRATVTLNDLELEEIVGALRRTTPEPGSAGYERHRALTEVMGEHLHRALYAISTEDYEEYDLAEGIPVAREFGLIPPHRGGAA